MLAPPYPGAKAAPRLLSEIYMKAAKSGIREQALLLLSFKTFWFLKLEFVIAQS
jgi:hypothetical protein